MISQAPVDQTDLIAGYKHASSIRRVKKEDLTRVYDEYGLKSGEVAGRTDVQLQTRAAKAVVDWWNKQQAAKAAAATPPVAAPAAPPAAPRPPATTSTAPPPVVPHQAAPEPVAVAPKPVVQPTTYPGLTSNTVAKPTTVQVAAALKAAGLTGTTVPLYALVSTTALNAWIAKVLYNRSLLNHQAVL